MVLAQADEIDAEPVGELSFGDDVAEDLRVGQRTACGVEGDVAEGVEAQFDCRHGSLTDGLAKGFPGPGRPRPRPVIMVYTMTGPVTIEAKHILRSAIGLAGLLVAGLLMDACGGRDAGGDWTVRVDTLPAGAESGGRTAASLRTNGKEGPEGEAPTHEVVLSFDCFHDNATVAIMTDQALRQGSTDVRMSLDSDPPRKLKGFAGTTSTGGKVVLTIAQDSLLALLTGHRRATLSYADGAGSYKTTAEFPISGLEPQRAPFLAACGQAKKG